MAEEAQSGEQPEDLGGCPEDIPSRFSQEWPVPWKPVWGTRDGLAAKVETVAARGTLGAISLLPGFLLKPLIGGLARVGRAVDRRHANAAREFIGTALGDMPKAELEAHVLQAYRHFLWVMVETMQMNRLSIDELSERIEIVWTEDAKRARDEYGGVILVSAHIGNWEAGVASCPLSGFDPFYGVAKPARNRPFSKLVQRDRERRGVRVLPRRGAMQGAPAVLRAGGSLGLLLDQRARLKPVLAPFFGRPARCDRSAGVLVRRLKAPVVYCVCYRTGEPLRFRWELPEVIWPEELAGASPEQVATRVNEGLERLILKAPDQYFWLHDRYRDTPRVTNEA